MRQLRRLSIVLGLGFVCSLSLAAAQDVEPGFKLLFNGKNLDGWKTKGKAGEALDGKTEAFKGRFKVQDGVLVIDPSVKGDVVIETAKDVGDKDVHIKFDFKAGDKCNNDLFLRGIKFDLKKGDKAIKEGWNQFEIIVHGDKAEVKINGESQKVGNPKGGPSPFGIRAEFGAIEIKNIRAK